LVKKISSGQVKKVKKYPRESWVGILFTAGQKYARVRLSQAGQGPSLETWPPNPWAWWTKIMNHLEKKCTKLRLFSFDVSNITKFELISQKA